MTEDRFIINASVGKKKHKYYMDMLATKQEQVAKSCVILPPRASSNPPAYGNIPDTENKHVNFCHLLHGRLGAALPGKAPPPLPPSGLRTHSQISASTLIHIMYAVSGEPVLWRNQPLCFNLHFTHRFHHVIDCLSLYVGRHVYVCTPAHVTRDDHILPACRACDNRIYVMLGNEVNSVAL